VGKKDKISSLEGERGLVSKGFTVQNLNEKIGKATGKNVCVSLVGLPLKGDHHTDQQINNQCMVAQCSMWLGIQLTIY
jgi:hypothetical protein